jgi:multidrug efflux pump subunit AcrB
VEEGVCRKIEDAIEDVEGVKEYGTTAAENVGTGYVEVQEGYDVQDVLDRVRSRIDSISTFPPDAERPIITELLKKEFVTILALSGKLNEIQLKEQAEKIKDNLQGLPEVSQVHIGGVRNYEISIEVSEQRLREYGISLDQVAAAVRSGCLNMAGGTIRTDGEDIRVRTLGRKYRADEFAGIVVKGRPDGSLVTLGQLADIHDGFTEDPIITRVDGRPAILINVMKTEEQDSIDVSNAVKRYLKRTARGLPAGVTLTEVVDLSVFVRGRIRLLLRNGLVGLVFVFLLLWLFLDLRLSFWAAMGIPTSIAGALIVLWWSGGSINMISLFGLIMVLGIIVDDAIVVGEAIYVHRRSGKPPLQSAVDGVAEVGLPVMASVTTTIVAFLPLVCVGGVMGKFIQILPTVVIACLAVSLIECLVLLPAHLGDLGDLNKSDKDRGLMHRAFRRLHHWTSGGLERFVSGPYARFIEVALNWRYAALGIAIAVLFVAVGLVRGGIIKFEVFPKLDGFVITSTLDYPKGTPTEIVAEGVRRVENGLKKIQQEYPAMDGSPIVRHVTASVGQTLGEFAAASPNMGAVEAVLVDSKNRNVSSDELLIAWEKAVGKLPGIRALSFKSMEAGPPGAPIEIWISGSDMDDILAASCELEERLRKFDGAYQIQSDFRQGKTELRFQLKPEAHTLGITLADLARQLHTAYYGNEAVRIQRGRDDIRVKIRYTRAERGHLSTIRQLRIRTKDGREVPLLAVATPEFVAGYSTIRRQNGFRNVAVTADLDTRKANASEIFAELGREFLPQLESRHPGLQIRLQGEKKKMKESFGSLVLGFPLAVLGIFIIIATMFRSYLQPLVILVTVPFGVIGAVIGHMLMGINLTMMSMFGIVALSGVVVNDAIVLIECINENMASRKMTFLQAVQQGGIRRFRAVLLTTISTIGGLLPLIFEKDSQARFLIPMALSIAGGVAFATLLTLVLIPSLLAILNDGRRLAWRMKYGSWPTREEVEPASRRRLGESILVDGEAGMLSGGTSKNIQELT